MEEVSLSSFHAFGSGARLSWAAAPAPCFKRVYQASQSHATASRSARSANPPRMRSRNRVCSKSGVMAVHHAGVAGARAGAGAGNDATVFAIGQGGKDPVDHRVVPAGRKTDFQFDLVLFVLWQAANDGRLRAGQQSLAGEQGVRACDHHCDQLETRIGAPKSGRMHTYKRHGTTLARAAYCRKSQNRKNAHRGLQRAGNKTVSYTHLTLPTNREV